MEAEAGAVVRQPPRGREGVVWLPARCFSTGQRLSGGPRLLQMVKVMRVIRVARDLLVVLGPPCV